MQLKSGARLESATCDTQVVVVRAPADDFDGELRARRRCTETQQNARDDTPKGSSTEYAVIFHLRKL